MICLNRRSPLAREFGEDEVIDELLENLDQPTNEFIAENYSARNDWVDRRT